MMRIFTILTLLVLSLLAHGQYVSPGTGATYTLNDLVAISEGVVTREGGEYFINHNLTISHTDKLLINTDVTVKVGPGRLLTFFGTLESNPPLEAVFTAIDPLIPFRGMRFEGSSASVLRNTTVKYGGGMQLIDTHMLIEDCVIRNNTMTNGSAAISLTNSNPVIRYTRFIENAGSAIASGANSTSSPQILFNHFIHNGTANTNRPQINMGPGGEDTLRIVGNTIEGLYHMAGGIGISNLLGVGQTRAMVKDNQIFNNRYGYAQMGNNISSVVKGNTVINNNIQYDAQQGGSGLNFYGTLNTNQAVVLNNIIRGNLWGITIQGNAQPNLGSNGRGRNQTTGGFNIIEGNINNGQVYGLYNNTPNTIQAQFNYWGTDDPEKAEEFIFGKSQNPDLGAVNFGIIWVPDNRIESFVFDVHLNEHLEVEFEGQIDHEQNTITIIVPEATDIRSITPTIVSSVYSQVLPLSEQAMDFSMPAAYTVTPFDGNDRTYLVYVKTQEPRLLNITFQIESGGRPVPDAVVTFNGQAFEPGTYSFEGLEAGTYHYTVEKNGYMKAEGSVVANSEDIILELVLEPATSIQPIAANRSFTVFPNPAKDYIEVSYSGGRANNTVRIFSITGNLMLEAPNVSQGQRIDISSLDNGLYLLQFHQGTTTLTQKFSVAR